MSNRLIKLFVEDIKVSIAKIELYIKNMTFDEFKNDAKTMDAVIRNIEIIGEATKHIPNEIRLKHIEIPWKEIIGTRSKVIHEYFGVDEAILWKTVCEDLPRLKKQIEEINI